MLFRAVAISDPRIVDKSRREKRSPQWCWLTFTFHSVRGMLVYAFVSERKAMLLRIFGLLDEPTWWHLNRIPAGGGIGLAEVLAENIPHARHMEFFLDDKPLVSFHAEELMQRWKDGSGRLIAKPAGSCPRYQPAPQLSLTTIAGPDAGRTYPLTRQGLSVGRSESRAQVRDPWLSAHEFDIRLSSNGTLVSPLGRPEFLWESGDPYAVGSSQFAVHRGPGQALTTPKVPAAFEIDPGQAPSPPNVMLQVIGATAPLVIGIVLMVVTGMWYFLLFSGISVIIAAVMITQYRRARQRFLERIRLTLDATAQEMRQCVYAPDQISRALSASVEDSLSLTGPQPKQPVLYLGFGIRRARLAQAQQDQRWEHYLAARAPIIVTLEPEHRTIITGDPSSLRSIKNWCIAQLLRHAKATGGGLMVDQQHEAGPPQALIDTEVSTETSLPQLIFTKQTHISPDENTTIFNLTDHTIHGALKATEIEPLGISSATLQKIREGLAFDQPALPLGSQYLVLSPRTMLASAAEELTTDVATGSMGLVVDLVKDGPHLLITGTTGSGKSELLLTVLAGLIERYPPAEVSMILLDFKGGASFNVLAPLPHVMSVETNHIAATSFRSLDAITAELLRRERLFAEYEVPDYVAFRRSYPELMLPRLIVAIDELRVLVDTNGDAAASLARLAATGRSLGFHLIIATQRIQGAVSTDMRANIGAVMSLRTATEHDSWEVLGTGDAYRISPTTPGRAFYKTGAGQPQLFQTSCYLLDDEPVKLIMADLQNQERLTKTTDWNNLTHQLCIRAAHLPVADPVIMPVLPPEVLSKDLATQHRISPPYEVIGLVDDPANCSQYPLTLGPVTGLNDRTVLTDSVAWVGTPDSGIVPASRMVCQHVLQRLEHKVLLDGGQSRSNHNGWDTYLHASEASPEALRDLTQQFTTLLSQDQHMTIVITDWGSWATRMVTGHFQGFEDLLMQLLRQYSVGLTLYIFGARELAGGRMIGMIPERLYLPFNSSAEHRMIWPKLISVPSIAGRAVLITADQELGGLAVQLSYDEPLRCAMAEE